MIALAAYCKEIAFEVAGDEKANIINHGGAGMPRKRK